MQPLRVVGVATDGARGEQGEHESWLSTEASEHATTRALLAIFCKLAAFDQILKLAASSRPRLESTTIRALARQRGVLVRILAYTRGAAYKQGERRISTPRC